jgi:gamma-glutamyl-gamma-aminobutyrate hydrolase PuuD
MEGNMNKPIIATTAPSIFTSKVQSMISEYYGAMPLLIDQNDPEEIAFLLDQSTGVVLAGGRDIWPGIVGKQVTSGDNLSKFDAKRDRRELVIINYCFEHNIPILAICRGFQIILIAKFELDFYSDIARGSKICHTPSQQEIELDWEAGEYPHFVTVLKQERERYFDREWVTSYHHQGVAFTRKCYNLGMYHQAGVRVIGYADLDPGPEKPVRIMEWVEGVYNPFVGCQFHCEIDWRLGNRASLAVMKRFKDLMENPLDGLEHKELDNNHEPEPDPELDEHEAHQDEPIIEQPVEDAPIEQPAVAEQFMPIPLGEVYLGGAAIPAKAKHTKAKHTKAKRISKKAKSKQQHKAA